MALATSCKGSKYAKVVWAVAAALAKLKGCGGWGVYVDCTVACMLWQPRLAAGKAGDRGVWTGIISCLAFPSRQAK